MSTILLILVVLALPHRYNSVVFDACSEATLQRKSLHGCGEPAWCEFTDKIQEWLRDWQQPEDSRCRDARFLVYDPVHYGVGSMIHYAALSLALAISSDRILYFHAPQDSNWKMWRPRRCSVVAMECYFERITSCILPAEDLEHAPVANAENWDKLGSERIVRVKDEFSIPLCSWCTPWKHLQFLDSVLPRNLRSHFVASEMPLMAQLVRYIVRPRRHTDLAVRAFLSNHFNCHIERPFASMHVRYGDKIKREAVAQPLQKYMAMLETKAPHIKTVFVSTETAAVIANLTRDYKNTTFQYIDYERLESGGPGNAVPEREFIASLANLYVSIHADFFVGSLSSNWCRLIHELERTRGDAGHDYWSVDVSQFSTCGW